LGYSVDNQDALLMQLENEAIVEWQSALNPVYVVRENSAKTVLMRCTIADAGSDHSFRIQLEDGRKKTFKFQPVEQQLLATQEIEELEWHQYAVEIPVSLPLGYHKVSLYQGRKKLMSSALIIAPEQCYMPDEIQDGKKVWGFSVQLYCLRSKRNWGIGDFSDLSYLAEHAAQLGADFIGLNPIHQLYPANPDTCSPYGPSYRRWLNYLYLDAETIDRFYSPDFNAWYRVNQFIQHFEPL